MDKRAKLICIVLMILVYGGDVSPNNRLTPQEIANKALDATVLLVMEDANGNPIGVGSGFFVKLNLIATNNHVIDKAASGVAKRVGYDTKFDIEGVIATDELQDLAIVQVAGSGILPLPLGDSDSVAIGDAVYVAGNPVGFEGTFSHGIISGIRGSHADNNRRLQMTAPISSGSSGGPVLNTWGEVIGVSVASTAGQNLNLAAPSNYLDLLASSAHTHSLKPLSGGKQSVSAKSYYLSGYAKLMQGQLEASIADYNAAIRLNPDYVDAYISRGISKHKLNQYEAAIADYDIAVRLNPDYHLTYANRGLAKFMIGQFEEALTDYDVAIQLNADYVYAYLNRALTLERLWLNDAALQDYNAVIRLNPDSDRAYFSRGHVKEKLGQLDAAIADYDIAIKLKPDYLSYVFRGVLKSRLGQLEAALVDYDTAIRMDSDKTFAYNNRAVVTCQLGHHLDAIADYDAVIRLKPNDARAYLNRGDEKAHLERYSDAILDYDIAIQLTPDDAANYYARGLAKDYLGRTWSAKRDFQSALTLAEESGDKSFDNESFKANLRILLESSSGRR